MKKMITAAAFAAAFVSTASADMVEGPIVAQQDSSFTVRLVSSEAGWTGWLSWISNTESEAVTLLSNKGPKDAAPIAVGTVEAGESLIFQYEITKGTKNTFRQDDEAGARQFRRCQSCHTLNEGGRHTVGPNLYSVIGHEAASAEGFNYSPQLTEAGLTWDVETLDAWIENPRAMVPGNRMSFVGLRDAADRRDVIGYLAVETAD